MRRPANRSLKLDKTKRDNLKVLYPAIHKEFIELRAVPFKVATIYGSFSFLVLGWTFANRANLEIIEIVALLVFLVLIAGYALQFLKNMEIHFQETGEVLNRIQTLLNVYQPSYFAYAFEDRLGNTLFPLNWKLTGLPKSHAKKLESSLPKGTGERNVGYTYAVYFIFLMFAVTLSWVGFLLAKKLWN